MNWSRSCIIICLWSAVLFLLSGQQWNQAAAQSPNEPDWTGFSLLLQFHSAESRIQFSQFELSPQFDRIGIERLAPLFPGFVASEIDLKEKLPDLSLMYRAYLKPGVNGVAIVHALSKHPAIRRAELEPRDVPMFYQPNDPIIAEGQFWPDLIRAFDAWTITRGDTNVVIGIVDTGFDLDHPDLVDALSLNWADPINGIDDDRDGYVDNFHGWDFGGANSFNPQPDNDPSVQPGGDIHGSFVSGAAAARSDNGIGTASPGFRAKFLPIKANSDDNPIMPFIYEGLVYAASKGCKIINCSAGSRLRSEIRQDIVTFVVRRYGALIVASMGNDASETLFYPASYDHVLSVGASDTDDRKSPSSTYTYLTDVLAPSQWVRHPSWDDTYISDRTGSTSIAAALVSSSAALLQAHYPTWTGLQLGEQLRMTADDILLNHNDSLQNVYLNKLGRGRINLLRALTERTPSVRLTSNRLLTPTGQPAAPGDPAELQVTLRNYLEPVSNLQVRLSTESPFLTITRGLIQISQLGTLQESTPAERFGVRLAENTPPNTTIWMRLDFESGAYRDVQYFQLLIYPTYLDFERNRLGTSLNSIGNFGFNGTGNAKRGLGVRLDAGPSWVFDAGLVVSERSDRVYDNIRTTFPNLNSDDFQTDSLIRLVEPVAGAAGQAFTQYSEQATGSRRITVRQQAYAWNNGRADESILLVYELTNNTNERMDSVHVGLFADWDIGTNTAEWDRNSIRFSPDYRLNYVFLDQNHVGMAALGDLPVHVRNVRFGEFFPFTDLNKHLAITQGIQQTEIIEADVMAFLGIGPVRLAPWESRRVAFVLVAGRSLADLQRNVRRQQIHFDCLTAQSTAELRVSLPDPGRIVSRPDRIENCRPAQVISIPLQIQGLALNQQASIRAVVQHIDRSGQAGNIEVPQPVLSFTGVNGFRQTLQILWFPNPDTRSLSALEIQFTSSGNDFLGLNCSTPIYRLELEDTTMGQHLLEAPRAICWGHSAQLRAPACTDCRYDWFCDGLFEGRSFNPVWLARRPGRWSVRIENRSGCRIESRPALLVENQGPVALGLDVVQRACQSGDSVQVAMRVEGGIPPYRYSFRGGALGPEPTTRAVAGELLVYQVHDAAGCSDESEEQVPAPRAGELRVGSLFVGRSGCPDCNRGFIVVNVAGGDPPYRYFLNGEERERTELRGLVRGDWSLRVVDSAGCAVERVVQIRE